MARLFSSSTIIALIGILLVSPLAPVFAVTSTAENTLVDSLSPNTVSMQEEMPPAASLPGGEEPMKPTDTVLLEEPVLFSETESFPEESKEETGIFEQLIDTIVDVITPNSSEETVTEPQSTVVEEDLTPVTRPYTEFMREINEKKILQQKDTALAGELDQFIVQEKKRLDDLGVSRAKQKAYVSLLQTQQESIDTRAPGRMESLIDTIEEWFGAKDTEEQIGDTQDPVIKISDNPAAFSSFDEPVFIQDLQEGAVEIQEDSALWESVKDIVTILPANAYDDPYMPVLDDVVADGEEIIINSDIEQLAKQLGYNPVNIFNFVRNTIEYEPYYGAKKGSVGCLVEKRCNDVDSASLTIALMRASGIPARYERSIAVVSASQLRDLLGVEQNKTAYLRMRQGNIPTFVLNGDELGDPLVGQHIDNVDIEGITQFAFEWVHPEIFVIYDERGANLTNDLFFDAATTTDAVRQLLRSSDKRQWIPAEGIFRPYQKNTREIVFDSANFDSEAFWHGFFNYQGPLSPAEKVRADLLAQTGKDITSPTYQSTRTMVSSRLSVIPSKTPYLRGEGTTGDGEFIGIERWSALPHAHRQAVRISLLDEETREVVFSHTEYGTAISNQKMQLDYEGMTDVDIAVIEQHGGIHATPAALVDVVPILSTGHSIARGETAVMIGQSLILQFELLQGDTVKHTDDKFATAGNSEGIFITLSRVRDIPDLDDTNNPNYKMNMLLEGNAMLAREHIRRIQEQSDLFSLAMDYGYQFHFSRAVVTQNRILNEVDGMPTTFNFQGLTLDAGSYINDQSNRGHYKTHQKDFRLLWGLQASYDEADILEDLTSIPSVSTVQGLQYAMAHPETYTVHTITSNNEEIIDQLLLSNNTKQQMHETVQGGGTVVTADRVIQEGAFRGVLYIALDDDWTGSYAIGEQVANGAWTSAPFAEEIFLDESGAVEKQYIMVAALNGDTVFYKDRLHVSGQLCSTSPEVINFVRNIITNELNDLGEKIAAGPCGYGTTQVIGGKQRSYVLAVNAVKFVDTPFDYAGSGHWVPISSSYDSLHPVVTKITDYIAEKKQLPENDLLYISNGKQIEFKFSTVLGTFLNRICANGWSSCDDSALYYVPYSDRNEGTIYSVRGGMFDKLKKNDNEVIKKIGLPITEESFAGASAEVTGPNNKHRTYQNFEYGQLYKYASIIPAPLVYYTFGEITNEHNQLRNGQRGTNTFLGFPKRDPTMSVDGNTYYQLFEQDNQIVWDLDSGETSVSEYYKYQCDLYGDIENSLLLGAISVEGVLDSGVQAVDGLIDIGVSLGGKLFHPSQTYQEIVELVESMQDIDMDDVNEFLDNTQNAVYQALQDEYERSTCEARQHYIGGRLAGEVLLIVVPTSKLSMGSKLKVLSRVELTFPKLKKIETIGNFGQKLKLQNAADVTEWNRIKSLPQVEKGPEGSRFWAERFSQGESQQEINFDVDDVNLGDRRVDVFDSDNNIAYEVKNHSTSVSADVDTVSQVNKDVWLMNNQESYRPVWVFIDKGPTGPLRKLLEENGIEILELSS